MTERGRNLAVGATTLGALVGLVLLLLLFGYVPEFFKGGYFVTVHMPDAGDLNVGSSVQLSGIDVGEVDSIDLRQPAGSGVDVIARIEEHIRLPQNVSAQIQSVGVRSPSRTASATARLRRETQRKVSASGRSARDMALPSGRTTTRGPSIFFRNIPLPSHSLMYRRALSGSGRDTR